MISKVKPRRETIDDFMTKIFQQWLEWRDTLSFMEETYEKQSKVIERYLKQIQELKQQLQELTTTKSIL